MDRKSISTFSKKKNSFHKSIFNNGWMTFYLIYNLSNLWFFWISKWCKTNIYIHPTVNWSKTTSSKRSILQIFSVVNFLKAYSDRASAPASASTLIITLMLGNGSGTHFKHHGKHHSVWIVSIVISWYPFWVSTLTLGVNRLQCSKQVSPFTQNNFVIPS